MQSFVLEKETELRCEVKWDGNVTLSLVNGTAEIFGTEIAPNQKIKFRKGDKFAVFTWEGATVELEGNIEIAYKSDETPMLMYANIHAVLDQRRHVAKQAWANYLAAGGSQEGKEKALVDSQGPRVITIGPTDSGKSSLNRILLGYATRRGWKPVYVDLDIGQGLPIPGTLTATIIDNPVDPTEGISFDSSLLYFYGHTTPTVNEELFRLQLRELAGMVDRQVAEADSACRSSGVLIDPMGWVEGLGYELQLLTIQLFKANVVLVLGQEKLYNMLKDSLKGQPGVEVIKVATSPGVVTRSKEYRANARTRRVKEYFEGVSGELSPHSTSVPFDNVRIFRVGGGPKAPQSALPIGAEPSVDNTRATQVTVGHDLLHKVLGVSYAKEQGQIAGTNCAGFVHVTEVDMAKRNLLLLAPCPGPLPSTNLVAGTLHWVP